MADVARVNLAGHANVEVVETTFENAHVDPHSFGLVTCAQTYHWLDEATRVDRIADALYAYGTAAIIANVQVTPDDNRAFFVRVQDVYREHAPLTLTQNLGGYPADEHQGDFRKPGDVPPHRFERSSLFTDLEQRMHEWHWTLPTAAYIGLMSTHSNHAALDSEVRDRLHAGIAELIDSEFAGSVTEHYVAVVDLARRTA
jgi:hypothetical protein